MSLKEIASKWLLMAEDDLITSELNYKNGRYSGAVFFAELCAQKCIKGLITALGFESGKTHRPSDELNRLIGAGLAKIPANLLDDVRRAINLATVLEDQGVTPRYGWKTVTTIITPSEIYNEKNSAELLNTAKEVFRIIKKVMGELDC